MAPPSKSDCDQGWLDCFVLGKLALTPLALYATATLYAVDILRVKKRTEPWIVIGIFQGAIISVVCFIFGLLFIVPKNPAMCPFLAPSFYVAVWYVVRARQLIKESGMNFQICFFSMVGALPFWVGSCLWSMVTYAGLPDKVPPSGCFIVTAATRGHKSIVGPFSEITHHGRRRQANRQLLTFWELEARWQLSYPGSHAMFRQIYNRIGPVIAAQIKSPWMADATCLALKPFEMAARLINQATIASQKFKCMSNR
jgi:hypothetical protein